MDAETVAERSHLALMTFSVLRDNGLFGSLELGVAGVGTEIVGLKDGEPVFMRFPLSGEAGGYVDLALQPWLGDPVVSVVVDVSWDPERFQAKTSALGYKWRRWVSYAAGEVALECAGVFLDPYRGSEDEPYVVAPRELRKEWGLPPARRADNERRYAAYIVALAASSAAGASGLSVPRFTAGPGPIDICSSASTHGGLYRCIPKLPQGDDFWCVPAVLEMVIEYFLAQQRPGTYQSKLARFLGLYGGSGLNTKDWPRIPLAVSDASSQAVVAVLIGIDWGSVVKEIDAKRPVAYLNFDHAFLVFGYRGAVVWMAVPAIAYLQVLDPWGLKVGSLSFSSLPSGSLLRFSQARNAIQRSAMKIKLWAWRFAQSRTRTDRQSAPRSVRGKQCDLSASTATGSRTAST
jgi:hypothetical protein